MSISEYREDFISLIPALKQFINLGYSYLPSSEVIIHRNLKLSQVLLEDILKSQIKKINNISFKGKQYNFSENNIEKAVAAIRDIPFDNLITTNEQVYDLIRRILGMRHHQFKLPANIFQIIQIAVTAVSDQIAQLARNRR